MDWIYDTVLKKRKKTHTVTLRKALCTGPGYCPPTPAFSGVGIKAAAYSLSSFTRTSSSSARPRRANLSYFIVLCWTYSQFISVAHSSFGNKHFLSALLPGCLSSSVAARAMETDVRAHPEFDQSQFIFVFEVPWGIQTDQRSKLFAQVLDLQRMKHNF